MPPETFFGSLLRELENQEVAASKASEIDAALNMFGGQHA